MALKISGVDRAALRANSPSALTASALAAAGGLAAALMASCAQTPTNVPVQTFEQPKSMDVVCLQVGLTDQYPNFVPIAPIPQPQAQCAQVPAGINGSELPYHLFALVTQETRGEVAVVDLTSGYVIDVDPSTPGINFLPVGRLPSDIATSPDGQMVYVGSADPNSPSIFALPSRLLLGDSQEYDGGEIDPEGNEPIPDLTTWPVCSLPQVPGAVRVLPNNLLPPTADGGAPETSAAGYVIVAVLPGDSSQSAKVAVIDPAPLLRGAGSNVDAGALPPGYQVDAGSLSACQILHYIPLAAPAAGTTWAAGPPWDDGVKYVDAGADVDIPSPAVACATPTDAGAITGGVSPLPMMAGTTPNGGATVLDTSSPRPLLYVADTEMPIIHVVDVSNPSAPVELAPLLATSLADPTRVVSIGQIAVSPTTREFKRFLYAVDLLEGSILVYDVTDPIGGPKVPLVRPHPVFDPFQPPDRILFGSPVASVAFVQNDWPLTQKYLPAGSSVSLQPLTNAETGLLCNPNPNTDTGTVVTAEQVAYEQGPFSDDGAYYRAAVGGWSVPVGPTRLRGIFAFATLTNGSVIGIDVDDWDAPCRRPDPLAAPGAILASTGPNQTPPLYGLTALTQPAVLADQIVDGPFSALAPPQPPPSGPTDIDPYHTPIAFDYDYTDSPVTLEWFYPVAAPHRARSGFFLSNTTTYGQHAPYLLGVPQLFAAGAPLATQGTQAIGNPSLVPTDSPFVDPSITSNPSAANPVTRVPLFTPAAGDAGVLLVQSTPGATPGIRFAWEDPEAYVDQDWTVTYEGPLPGFFDSGGNPLIQADVRASNQTDIGGSSDGGAPDYSAAWLYNTDGYFCSKGIEDVASGAQRADATNAALGAAQLPAIAGFDSQVGDYIQVWNPVRAPTDTYWAQDNACWSTGPSPTNVIPVDQRASLCASTYGLAPVNAVLGGPTTPITSMSLQRDFPIIEAYDGKLLIGRFAYVGGQPVSREPGSSAWAIVGRDPSNAPFLKLMQCCFGDQIWFNVRTGGQWSVVGSNSGFLHHVVATGSDGRCGPSCEARDALLNGRAPPVPRQAVADGDAGAATSACTPGLPPSITRDNVLAMRNPLFSFLVWNGQDTNTGCSDAPPSRDMAWTFSTCGSFSPLYINIAGASTNVSPQTMKFIDSLGQLAVIDGASQGLILINLDTIALAHAPYF